MLLHQTPQSILVVSTVVSTFTFLATITALPIFFMKVQRINSQMLMQVNNCHQDGTDIWKQLSQENVRGKRSYGRVDAQAIPNGKCCSCQQGKPGAIGPKGPDGAPGQPGLIGVNGRNGRSGKYVASEYHKEPACQKCPQAPPGPPGHPGRKGPRGSAGTPGTAGKNGIPGRMGPPGPPGVRGPPGDLGMQGPQGDPGKVLNGAPQGQPGRPGRVGARGKAGHTGRDGRPGLEGIPGARGVQGERGARGARGPPGPPGPAGTDGRRGSCAHCASSEKPGAQQQQQEEYAPVTTETPTQAPTTTQAPQQYEQRSFPSAIPNGHSSNAHSETSNSEDYSPVQRQNHQQNSHQGHQPQVNHPVNSNQGYSEELIPKTINYPDTVAQPSHKHDGDVTSDDNSYDVIPAGRYSAARQYAAKNRAGTAKSIGYSNDQLSEIGAYMGQEDEEFGQPRAFQTSKGYNVQIMGSGPTYGAAPVGSTWQKPSKGSRGPPRFLPAPTYA